MGGFNNIFFHTNRNPQANGAKRPGRGLLIPHGYLHPEKKTA